MDHVVDVRGGRAVAARRRSRRSASSRPPRRAPAGSSCRPRPTRAGAGRRRSRSRRALASRTDLLGHRLGRRVERLRVGPQRQRPRSRSRAACPPAGPPRSRRARTGARPRRAAVSSALRVPPTLMRSNSSRSPHSPRCAAAWKTRSAPAAPGAHRIAVLEVAARPAPRRARPPSPPPRPSGPAPAPASRLRPGARSGGRR